MLYTFQCQSDLAPILESILHHALHFVSVRHTEVASGALDFWFNLLTSFMGARNDIDDEDDIFLGKTVVQIFSVLVFSLFKTP